MALSVDLDHVAIATDDVTELLHVLVSEFGTPVLFGGINFGFRAMQVDAGDMRIELLEPFNTEQNDFLARFLERNGPGPHHLTFKTDDIRALMARVEEAGFPLVGVNIDNPFWREAFIHPKHGGGTVIQIAQSDFDPVLLEQEVREYGPGRWWPEPPMPAATRAILRRVVVTTDEMARFVELYRDVLQGEVTRHDEGWLEMVWPGGSRIRLEHAAGRPPGIDRLEWEHGSQSGERTECGTRFYSVSS